MYWSTWAGRLYYVNHPYWKQAQDIACTMWASGASFAVTVNICLISLSARDARQNQINRHKRKQIFLVWPVSMSKNSMYFVCFHAIAPNGRVRSERKQIAPAWKWILMPDLVGYCRYCKSHRVSLPIWWNHLFCYIFVVCGVMCSNFYQFEFACDLLPIFGTVSIHQTQALMYEAEYKANVLMIQLNLRLPRAVFSVWAAPKGLFDENKLCFIHNCTQLLLLIRVIYI